MNLLQRIFGGPQLEPEVYSRVHTDIHSHLIPGIDDGSSSIEQSLEMIKGLHSLGYRKLITTPHVMSDAFRNTPEIILGGLEKLREAVKAEGIEIELEAAAEYYLDDTFSQKLDAGNLLTFGADEKYLLVETSYVAQPMGLNDLIFQMLTKGYQPVLAHPERYQYFWDGDALYNIQQLRDRGLKLQVNISSFVGRNSKMAAQIVRSLCNEGLVDFIGSDLHRPQQLETLRKAPSASKELRHLIEQGNLLNSKI
jgi:tyrosine-protein phosphatase YwqE